MSRGGKYNIGRYQKINNSITGTKAFVSHYYCCRSRDTFTHTRSQ